MPAKKSKRRCVSYEKTATGRRCAKYSGARATRKKRCARYEYIEVDGKRKRKCTIYHNDNPWINYVKSYIKEQKQRGIKISYKEALKALKGTKGPAREQFELSQKPRKVLPMPKKKLNTIF